jgi:pyruvate dehydrogenase E1 component
VRRQQASQALTLPGLDIFANFLEGSGDREISTTMAFVRMMSALIKDKQIGERVVPIVPDEARTFGMEGLFRQLGIYSSGGQKYEPEDAGQVMYYREDKKGRILEEGINEAGAMSGWLAAATSYSVHDFTLIPFYIYYSMFGFQRVGDLCWAAGDSQARGFLLGATAGRTTLNGEGLQHQDGHSHILASTVPNCVSYDPTYSYELAVILHDGLKRMYEDNEKVFYYLTLMNENYVHGAMTEGAEEGIRRGMYLLREGKGKTKKSPRVQLLGCGTILREVEAAAELLRDDFGVAADVWSVTSFNELRREGLRLDRDDILHPDQERETTWVEKCLDGREGPVIASTDYMRAFADQIRPWVHAPYTVLGTDGFGRSDSRQKLRHFFEVDRYFVVLAALNALRKADKVDVATVKQAIEKYGIDTDKPYPVMH